MKTMLSQKRNPDFSGKPLMILKAAAIILCLTLNLELRTSNCFAQVANGTGAGNCLSYNGTTNYVSVGNNSFPTGSSPRTITLWFKFANSGSQVYQSFFNYGSNANGQRFDVFYDPLGLGVETVNYFRYFSWVPDVNWHHFAVVVPNGATQTDQILLYFDGVLQTGQNLYSPQTLNTTNWNPRLGELNVADICNFNGLIDETAIWNRALTQTEIRDNMCKKLIGSESGLVGYWRFDEGSGSTVYDASGNGNDGTLY